MTEIAQQIKEIRKKQENLEIDLSKLVRTVYPDYKSMWETVGYWECEESPIGLCIYNHMEDKPLDDCLFCHQPHERK